MIEKIEYNSRLYHAPMSIDDPTPWRIDLILEGVDYHAIGKTPAEALIQLALFIARKQEEREYEMKQYP
jgi:hypothetical protein